MMIAKDTLLKLGVGALVFAPYPSFAVCNTAVPQQNALQQVTGSTTSCDDSTLGTKTSTLIDALFIVVGAITVIIMIIGGIRYITSTGNAQRVQQAKDTILYAIIGLIVVILARAIVGFVIGKIA